MRLVIDLQGAQGINRHRGIGRLTRALARAMIAAPGRHEPIILLNDALPASAETLSDEFSTFLPRRNIRFWRGLTGAAAIGGARSVARRRAAEKIRAQYIAGLEPDAVHVSSVVEGAADDTITNWPADLERPPHVATFYDVIPLINRDQYLRGTWQHLARWYLAQMQEMRLYDGLLAISQSSRSEAIDHLGFDPECVFNVRAGFDPVTFGPVHLQAEARTEFLARHGLREGYLLFVGAGDLRKNERGLVQAYALLPKALRVRHQLIIVGAGDPTALQELAASCAVPPDDLALPRHVPEPELAVFYSTCRLFVMPSKHEGFGLPALEAMACGAPVIASNTTSLPELVGTEEALFDPHDIRSIAARMQAVLEDEALRLRLIEHGLRRAAEFTWEESARRAWAALETMEKRGILRSRQAHGTVPRSKPRLAYVGGLLATRPGAPGNDAELVYELARHYNMTLVVRSQLAEHDALGAAFPTLNESDFLAEASRFDRILYRIGGAETYRVILQLLLPQFPGVVILHDACLAEFHLAEFQRHGDQDAMARALFESHGWRAIDALHRNCVPNALHEFACTLPVFRDALAVVQHTARARAIACQPIGQRAVEMVRLIPPARGPLPRIGKSAARLALGLDALAPVVVSIGSVSAPQDGFTVLQAWQHAMRGLPGGRLAFVGMVSGIAAVGLRARAEQGSFADRILVADKPDDATYRLWLEAADIAVQMHADWRGEGLDAILDALAMGLPVLAAADYPGSELLRDALCQLPHDAQPDLIAAALTDLWSDAPRRAALATAGMEYVRTHLRPRGVAQRYHAVIEEAYSRGLAARLQASMPILPEDDYPNVARALMQSFQSLTPRRLLLDVECTADLESTHGPALRELTKRLLIDPGDGWIANLVRFDEGTLRFAHGRAAALLDLPLHGLSDAPVLGSSADTLTVLVGGKSDAVALRSLRRCGVRVIALILHELDEQPPEIVSLADGMLCGSLALAEAVTERLENGAIKRQWPVDIGWLTSDIESFLQILRSDRWEVRWPRS